MGIAHPVSNTDLFGKFGDRGMELIYSEMLDVGYKWMFHDKKALDTIIASRADVVNGFWSGKHSRICYPRTTKHHLKRSVYMHSRDLPR
jgi:hypothetical protein